MIQQHPMTYKIPVQQNKIKNNQVTALHLMVGILFFVIGLVTWGIPSSVKTMQFLFLENFGILYSILGISILIISIFYNKKIIQTKKGEILRIIELLALFIIIIYSFFQRWYLPVAYSLTAMIGITFAYFWEKKAKKSMFVHINEKGIQLPFFIKDKLINWHELERVIIKHNVLSIDCRNNKLIQYNINFPYEFDHRKAEQYSMERITENAHLAIKNW